MGQRDIIALFVDLFDKFEILYILTGSFAGSFWGHPRATHDIDFVVEIEPKNKENFLAFLKALPKDFQVDFDQVERAYNQKGQFNIFYPDLDLKIDFWIINQSNFEKNKFKRRVITEVFGKKVAIVSAEDLILTKLSWVKEVYSDRHFRDCVGILERQKGYLDEKYLQENAQKLEVLDLLKEAKEDKYF